jgi:O-antigen ligase
MFLILTLLLFSTCLPPIQGLTDDVLMPKWYGVVMMGMVTATIHLTLPKREDKVYRGRYMGSSLQIAVMLVLTYHLVYALVADVIMTGSAVIKGVFDNPTGFALHTCVLVAMIKQTHPQPLPVSEGSCFRLMLTRYGKGGIWVLTISSAAMVFLSGCRTGMICMAGTILLMIYQEAKRWVKTDTLRLWGRIVGVGFLLVVMLYVFSVKQESTGGRRFILERTWELIENHPLTGYGWHGFEREYMPHQAQYFQQHPDSPAAWYADEISHPLNEFLYLWVDFGIIAPLLLLLLFAVPYYFSLQGHRSPLQLPLKGESTGHRGALLMPVMVVLLFSLTSYPFLYPLPLVVMVLTYMVMLRKPISRLKQRYRKTVTVTSIGICIAGLTLTIWEMTCEHEWAKLNRAVERHYTAAVIDRYDKLSSHYSSNARFLYSYMVAQYKVSRLDEATNTYHQLRQYADTYDMELLAGDTYRHKQRYAEALQHYETAMWMCPVRFAPLEGMMQTYRDSGDLLRADSIAQVILAKPVKVPSPQVEEIKRKARDKIGSRNMIYK